MDVSQKISWRFKFQKLKQNFLSAESLNKLLSLSIIIPERRKKLPGFGPCLLFPLPFLLEHKMKKQFEAERQAYFLQGAEENLASKDSTCHSALSKHLKNSYFSHLQTTKQWDFIVHDERNRYRYFNIYTIKHITAAKLQHK